MRESKRFLRSYYILFILTAAMFFLAVKTLWLAQMLLKN